MTISFRVSHAFNCADMYLSFLPVKLSLSCRHSKHSQLGFRAPSTFANANSIQTTKPLKCKIAQFLVASFHPFSCAVLRARCKICLMFRCDLIALNRSHSADSLCFVGLSTALDLEVHSSWQSLKLELPQGAAHEADTSYLRSFTLDSNVTCRVNVH